MPVDERVARSVALEQAYVHDVYEQFYDNPRSKPWPKVQQFLEELEPGSLVCDVGCGNGKYLNANTSIFNVGGDKSTRLTEVAREKENEVIVLDNLALPYRDESLDAVLSIAVVHHLATTERRICALRELARVLRIGGRLIISVWAMEQSHRKFESQDVLVPWHRPKHLSPPSLELTSTTNTSEDDCLPPYHAYTQTSTDSDSNRSMRSKAMVRKRGKTRHKGRSIDPGCTSSPSSSSLSSPNETCYSFVRKAIQKLAGGRRGGGVHRPWFLDSWGSCSKEPRPRGDLCDCGDCMESIQDLPIELRRVDDEENPPQRRQTFPSSQLINDIANNFKSKSMTNIKATTGAVATLQTPSLAETVVADVKTGERLEQGKLLKPRLVKQKKSICEEDADEALDQPTDMKTLISNLPEFKVFSSRSRGGVLKQRSLNEELMSTDRLREKERVRKNIQKQASLNENLIYHQSHNSNTPFDSFKDSFFSVSTSKRFQLIKTGFTNKLKNSATIEKVTSATSLRNGFARMFQNWKSSDLISPEGDSSSSTPITAVPSAEPSGSTIVVIEDGTKKEATPERRHSKEDGSDSSKDSSLQSDTSVDSEDSFASVIFVPKSDPMSPTVLSPGPISPRLKNQTPRIKQSSCPTSPRIKQMPLALYPLTKQLSSPKPSTSDILMSADKSETSRDHPSPSLSSPSATTTTTTIRRPSTLAQKYSVAQIPKFKTTTSQVTTTEKSPETRTDRLKKIKELLTQKPGFGSRTSSKNNFPIVRHSSVTNGKVEAVAKPLPKLLSLELFNPETDDKDSDSSCVSSPDSVDSVINVRSEESSRKFKFPPSAKTSSNGKKSLLEAAANVAQTLDEAVEKVIKSGTATRAKRKVFHPISGDVLSIIESRYNDTAPLLMDSSSWDEGCHKHLATFADRLSEKLLQEIDQYQVKSRSRGSSIEDPYIHRLSEELDDLSRLSAEIQKQNEYLEQLSVSDSLFGGHHHHQHHKNSYNGDTNSKCGKCGVDLLSECRCRTTRNKSNNVKANKEVLKGEAFKRSVTNESLSSGGGDKEENNGEATSGKLAVRRASIKMGTSTDSCDSDKGSSTNSMVSSVATSINFGQSVDSAGTISRYSDDGSTASLASCPEWKNFKRSEDRLTNSTASLTESGGKSTGTDNNNRNSHNNGKKSSTLMSDTSQDSLPSDNVGGEITYHRYYHVFREGELDQLIEKYVENLHIISSYYDHASWCIIAEKVQVWTI